MIHSTSFFFSLLFVVNFLFFFLFSTPLQHRTPAPLIHLSLFPGPRLFSFENFLPAFSSSSVLSGLEPVLLVSVCVCLGGVCVGVNASVCGREGVSVCVGWDWE